MLRSFCDKCGTECQSKHSGSRRFETLAMAASGKQLGLEIIPLFAKEASPVSHLCDGCIPELLEQVVGTYIDSSVTQLKADLKQQIEVYKATDKTLQAQINTANEKERLADNHMRSAAERVAVAEAQHKADLARIQVLTSQVEALRNAQANRERQAAAEAAQREADERSYPDYAMRVAAREKKRMTG